MAEKTLTDAWEVLRQDMATIYEITTPVLSRPCLALLRIIGGLFVLGQIVLLIIMVLFMVKLILRKLGYPVQQTMHRIYLFIGFCSVAQICLSSFVMIISLQTVFTLLFVAFIGAYTLD